jgi:hypothetical protein
MLDFQFTYSPWNEYCSQNGNDIYASRKISDYFDIQNDISCNVRHFAVAIRDPFSILEAQDTVKARKSHFHMLLQVLKLN